MSDKLEKLHEASMRILGRTGVKFHHPKAVAILKENGVKVEGNVAFFTEQQVMHHIQKAPDTFTLYAANPNRNVTIGGDAVRLAPAYGAPLVADKYGVTRTACIQDYVNLAKLYQGNEDFNFNGGQLVMPSDVPVEVVAGVMHHTAMSLTDKPLMVSSGDKKAVDLLMAMTAARFGGKEAMMETPRVLTIVNTNTPLQFDTTMLDTLLTFARHRQPVVIAAAAMAGTTAPMTIAGTIALANAEVLAGIVLAQMASPGTPVIYASQSAVADMKTCLIAIGAPESALCYQYCARLAKFYGLPCRGGGSITDASLVNAQAGYESMLTFMTCYQNNMNLIIHSAGILEGYASVSYEKLMMDFEVVRYVKRFAKGIEVNDVTVPEDLIHEAGHGGQYLTSDHTLELCRSEALEPNISQRGPVKEAGPKFEGRISAQIQQRLAEYVRPELDLDALGQAKKVLLSHGVTEDLLLSIQAL